MRWVNPVRSWNGYRPVVSDGYSATKTETHREHHGVDVMFQRRGALVEAAFPAGTPSGSKMFFMPGNVHVVAAADGVLWSSKLSGGGYSVVIDHGAPWSTYYQHMERLLVPLRAAGKGGMRLSRGQPIGIVGAAPTGYALKHLHFEMWKGGGASAHVNPQLEGFDSWDVATDEGGGLEVLIVPVVALVASRLASKGGGGMGT